MELLYRRPYWNVWSILVMVFVVWHATYAWVFDGVRDGAFLLGDDATVALITGAGGLAGLLIGIGQKFGANGPVQGRSLMPNLLFCMGLATIIALEVIGLAAFAVAAELIDLKGVVIGTILALVFGLISSMVGVAAGLVEEAD